MKLRSDDGIGILHWPLSALGSEPEWTIIALRERSGENLRASIKVV